MKRSSALSILSGAAIGVVVGLAVGNLPVWLAVGAGVGLVLAFGASRRGLPR